MIRKVFKSNSECKIGQPERCKTNQNGCEWIKHFHVHCSDYIEKPNEIETKVKKSIDDFNWDSILTKDDKTKTEIFKKMTLY